MAARSRVSRLPQEIRDQVNRLIREGRTIDEIRAALEQLGAPTSRGAVGRYVQSARKQLERYREASTVAGQWVRALGEKPDGDVGALLAEMLKTIAFQAIGRIGDTVEDKDVKPADLMFLAKAVQTLGAATKQNLDLQERIEKAVLAKNAKAAEVVARERGLSDDQWSAIRAKFLGIPEAA